MVFSGVVRDENNTLVPDATVTVRKRNRAIVQTATDQFGRYRISVGADGIPAQLVFDTNVAHSADTTGLSTVPGDHQVVNKRLNKTNGPETFEAIVEQIMFYDRLRISYSFGGNAQQMGDYKRKYLRKILSIPHPARCQQQGAEQKKTVGSLTDSQQNVVDRLMGWLLRKLG